MAGNEVSILGLNVEGVELPTAAHAVGKADSLFVSDVLL